MFYTFPDITVPAGTEINLYDFVTKDPLYAVLIQNKSTNSAVYIRSTASGTAPTGIQIISSNSITINTDENDVFIRNGSYSVVILSVTQIPRELDVTELNQLQEHVDDNTARILVLEGDISTKQDTLVSGFNIKTINGSTILGSGDIVVSSSDATTTSKGIIQIAGDLIGTAEIPRVNKLNGVTITGTPANGHTLYATSSTAAVWLPNRVAIARTSTQDGSNTYSQTATTTLTKIGPPTYMSVTNITVAGILNGAMKGISVSSTGYYKITAIVNLSLKANDVCTLQLMGDSSGFGAKYVVGSSIDHNTVVTITDTISAVPNRSYGVGFYDVDGTAVATTTTLIMERFS